MERIQRRLCLAALVSHRTMTISIGHRLLSKRGEITAEENSFKLTMSSRKTFDLSLTILQGTFSGRSDPLETRIHRDIANRCCRK